MTHSKRGLVPGATGTTPRSVHFFSPYALSIIEARQKAIRARVAKKERARDTHRKILVGAFFFHEIENDRKRGSGIRKWLQGGFPGFLRGTDQELFPVILEAADGEGSGGGKNAGTAGEATPTETQERNARKMTNSERVLKLIRSTPDLDDGQIAAEPAINRSIVYQECALLARARDTPSAERRAQEQTDQFDH
ncbi:MAG: hypothetical protein OXF88_10510 [Rhodobacteraceae bacterium]|nr:hypothetical protein [Paracoccaceae bacterium]MCY4141917.1 hypothetical protein [Paracoccaceae bacterium]